MNFLTRHYFLLQASGLLLLAMCSCAQAQTEYSKAIVEPSDVEKAIAVAKGIDSRTGCSAPQGTPWFEVKKGRLPVIITAPHSTQPFREGKYRFADGGATGGLADALNAICDVTVMYTTYDSPPDSKSDPNYYDDNEFKAHLERLIIELKPVLLLDIHASSPYRPYDVDLGTMDGASLLGNTTLIPPLIDALEKESILSISMNRFAASANQTITKYAASKGVPAVQLEFSSTRMSPLENLLAAHRFAQSIEAITKFLSQQGVCARTIKEGKN